LQHIEYSKKALQITNYLPRKKITSIYFSCLRNKNHV